MFTFPGDRRRGLGRQVVEAASDDIRRSDVDVGALLCDPELEPSYRSSGWVAVPAAATVTADGATLQALRMVLVVSDTAHDLRHRLTTEPLLVPTAPTRRWLWPQVDRRAGSAHESVVAHM